MPPRFSVVIPTFNRSDLFPYTVQSILNQTFEDFEIVLSDNCSSDDTPEAATRFRDPRFRYVRTPRHVTIADSFEFARTQAAGKLIMMLSDDDALVNSALKRIVDESEDDDKDFIFTSLAEYRDVGFPGPDKNTVSCPPYSGLSRVVTADDFIRPLFSLRPNFTMHPSGFVFPRKLAEDVQRQTGRFFWTNGVEYSAWPIAAVFARRIVHVDLPLAILGRTAKSWGSNLALCNPGKEKIQDLIKDVDHDQRFAVLHNFTMINLVTEGMLTAKHLFPKEFASYEIDELRYLRMTIVELRKREALGVDVTAELDEALRYSSKYPDVENELRSISARAQSGESSVIQSIRSGIGKLLGARNRGRFHALQLRQQLEKGKAGQGFQAAGNDFGFSNILECSEFFQKSIVTPRIARSGPAVRPAQTRTAAGA